MSFSARSLSLTPIKSRNKYFQPEGAKKLSPASFSNPRLFNFHQIQPYKNINQPKFTNQKRETILQRVQIEKEARVVSQDRIKSKDLFFRYRNNPFVNLSQRNLYSPAYRKIGRQQKAHRSTIEEFQQDEEYCETIVQALGQPPMRIKQDQKFKKFRETAEVRSDLISHSIPPIINTSTLSLKPVVAEFKKQRDLTFEQILQLPDENYYTNNLGQINLFLFMKGNILPGMANYSALNKYHFSFASNIQKNDKIKVPIYRDISKAGREFALDKFKGSMDSRLQFMRSTEISVNWTKLRYEDLLSIASGRMNSKLAFHLKSDIDNKQDLAFLSDKSEIPGTEVLFNENTNQKLINFNTKDEEWQEVKYYKELDNHPQEMKFAKKCKKYHQNVKNELRSRGKLCKNAIKDSIQHKMFKDFVNKQCEALYNLKSSSNLEKDMLVRVNKVNKNRNDVIKIKQMIESLVLKNTTEAEMQALFRRNGKKRMI